MWGQILCIFLLLCIYQNYCFVSRLYRKSNVKSFDILESFQMTTSKIECLSHCLNSQTCEGVNYIPNGIFPCSTLNNIIAEDDLQFITDDIWIDPRILVPSEWTEWTEWTDCKNATRQRSRLCILNELKNPCQGINEDFEPCQDFPNCPNFEWIGDGYCDDENNIIECNFDGGDCCTDTEHTHCTECLCKTNGDDEDTSKICDMHDWIGDGFCDDENNVPECDYDGGDCCIDTDKDYCTVCECIKN